jgi:hypothetical protein
MTIADLDDQTEMTIADLDFQTEMTIADLDFQHDKVDVLQDLNIKVQRGHM